MTCTLHAMLQRYSGIQRAGAWSWSRSYEFLRAVHIMTLLGVYGSTGYCFLLFLYKIPHFGETREASHATTRKPR
jgi:hypothetical protein